MKYRPEIDGLRAISVSSVFLFHLSDKSASGGFVGVDIFFVISGYLITALVAAELKGDRFSLVSFYVRRVKRIVPALLVTVFLVICAGYFLLPPGDYAGLARSGLFALGGASNFYFLNNTGYFDAAAETMPLLHTWSLGVEEQFYVAWPSLLILFWKISGGKRVLILAFLAVLAGVSLGAYGLATTIDPKLAFFMPYTRAWEFALGGALSFLPAMAGRRLARIRPALPWIGLALIAISIWQFRAAVDLTGNKVVASVIGAGLIIYFIEPASATYRLLASKPFVALGRISYSLYLLHLPIIVFWKYYAGAPTVSLACYPLIIVGAIAAAWLSWRFIEQPCRRAAWDWKAIFSAFLIGDLAVASLCGAVVASDGAADRIPESIREMGSLDGMWEWPCPSYHRIGASDRCTGGTPWESASAHAVVWGDSQAGQFMPFLDVAARRENVSISLIGSCAPIVATGYALLFMSEQPTYMQQCDEAHQAAIEALKSKDIGMVILAAAWSGATPRLYRAAGERLGEATGLSAMKTAFDRLLPEITVDGRKVGIITQVPRWFSNPVPCVIAVQTQLLRRASFRQSCQVTNLDKTFYQQFQKKTDDLMASFDGNHGVTVWRSADDLCSDQSCTAMIDGEFIYRDEGHFRRNLDEKADVDLADRMHFPELMDLAKTSTVQR